MIVMTTKNSILKRKRKKIGTIDTENSKKKRKNRKKIQ